MATNEIETNEVTAEVVPENEITTEVVPATEQIAQEEVVATEVKHKRTRKPKTETVSEDGTPVTPKPRTRKPKAETLSEDGTPVTPKPGTRKPKVEVSPVEEIATEAQDVESVKQEEIAVTEVAKAKKKILFVASECTPFIATGGLAEVIGSLSKALAKDPAYDVRVIVPLYADIKAKYRVQFQFLGNIYIPLSWRSQYCGIFAYEENNVKFYFVDNEYYFKRPGCYGYYDDGERFAYFSRAVMEIMGFLQFYPEIMHCHDWQAALASLYLKTIYCFREEYQYIRSVFTIHNIEYQGKYSLDILEDLFGISNQYRHYVEYDGCINLMKGAIEVSEKFSTVSPKYAEEIKDPYYAHGLEKIVKRNEFKLCGILNGIDVDSYNSATDQAIFENFDKDTLDKKAVNKEELQKLLNLPVSPKTPVIAMISRLVSHKGLDLVTASIERLLEKDVQVVILGTGDSYYENYFRDLSRKYVGKLDAIISFNSDLARKIYAGADMFLMPSKSEPCGLSQMIASRYATVPIVRETGGLYDSIKPEGNGGNGFTFAAYNADDMLYVINTALECYKNEEYWKDLMTRAITTDFSWDKSAKEYVAMYNDVLNK